MSNRLSGPGKDFDDQWNESRRQGKEKAARGESHWAADKALERYQQSLDASSDTKPQGRHAKPSSDSCVTALALLGGIGWAVAETITRLT